MSSDSTGLDHAAAPCERQSRVVSPFFIVKDLNASISHYVERSAVQLGSGITGDVGFGPLAVRSASYSAILPDVLPVPNHMRHEWARWDACVYTLDPTAVQRFKRRGASFVKELSFIDDGLWGFEVTDADG